jgi:hypothetical protein
MGGGVRGEGHGGLLE